jgi:hypothetical protein
VRAPSPPLHWYECVGDGPSWWTLERTDLIRVQRRPSSRESHQVPMRMLEIYVRVGGLARVFGGSNGVTLDCSNEASTIEAVPSEPTSARPFHCSQHHLFRFRAL